MLYLKSSCLGCLKLRYASGHRVLTQPGTSWTPLARAPSCCVPSASARIISWQTILRPSGHHPKSTGSQSFKSVFLSILWRFLSHTIWATRFFMQISQCSFRLFFLKKLSAANLRWRTLIGEAIDQNIQAGQMKERLKSWQGCIGLWLCIGITKHDS